MVCCSLLALAAAGTASSGLRARLGLALAVVLVPAVMLTGLWHFGHYAARAQASERTLLAELLAQPICTGAPAPATNRGDEND